MPVFVLFFFLHAELIITTAWLLDEETADLILTQNKDVHYFC